MRTLLLMLLGAVCLPVTGGPALACLNDKSMVRSEEEFRAGYETQSTTERMRQAIAGTTSRERWVYALSAGMLCLAAYRIGKVRRKRNAVGQT